MQKHVEMSESTLDQKTVLKNPGEQSFTLIEVIISVGMLTAVVLQMVGGQGSVFGMIDYSQRSSEAIWLAKRMMSQVEYFASYMDFKELETTSGIRDQPFKFEKGTETDAEYQYSIDVKEWKLPLFDLLTGGGPKKEGEEDEDAKPKNPGLDAGGFDSVVDTIFEGQILKVAQVEVSWPEGARRNSVSLSMLLANQKKLDEYIATKKGVWDTIAKKAAGAQQPPPPPRPPGGGQNPDPNNPQNNGSTDPTGGPAPTGGPRGTPTTGGNPGSRTGGSGGSDGLRDDGRE